jgi:hypothetical protein
VRLRIPFRLSDIKSRSSHLHPNVFNYIGFCLRTRVAAVLVLLVFTVLLISVSFIPSAKAAIGRSATEIGLPEDASPDDVLDRLCTELKKHPDQSIEIAKWAVAYFEQQIRNTPAFATTLGVVFVDCMTSAAAEDPKSSISSLAQQIADTLLTLYISMDYLPTGSLVGSNMLAAALATLGPELSPQVKALLSVSLSSGVASGDFFDEAVPSTGDIPIPTPSVTPLPTPTPPVTPDVNS